jgi:hypothetical protein
MLTKSITQGSTLLLLKFVVDVLVVVVLVVLGNDSASITGLLNG